MRSPSSSSLDSPSFRGSDSQSLSSILNNPHTSRTDPSSSSWWWPSSSSSAAPPPFPDPLTPILPSSPLPSPSLQDFLPYLSLISDPFSKFEHVRRHSLSSPDPSPSPHGDALVACLREVPSLFFKEDFALEDAPTFRAACPLSPDNASLQDRLSQYLDVVETHLVREISLRSESFFEAQGRLQGLDGEIVEACIRIAGLREVIRALDAGVVDPARKVRELNDTRGNLVVLHQKLTIILYVSQALAALKLLVTSADCAGALDVIDDLQHLQDSEELNGLHCFRHLRDQLANSVSSVNSILSAEFMHVATLGAKDVDSLIMSKFRAKAPNATNGVDEEVKLDEEEGSIFRDRLLPLIIGLLRTAKLPYVLRIYRDALISDMKTSIKSTVAELLPVLLSRNLESDSTIMERTGEGDGGGLSLASKLRSLSSESFVQLLSAIFRVVQSHLVRAAEVKRVIEWIMSSLNGCDAADSAGTASSVSTEASQDCDIRMPPSRAASLQRNPPKIFLHGKANESANPSTTKNFRADVLRENTEAVFAACDAAHGRWAKLLGVRALLHPKLKLNEFLSVYTITQDFITSTEKIGGRLGYSIRGTLQSQSKAFVDFQHDSRMAKIKAVLDQETWVLVDVPEEFQAIVESFSSSTLSGPDTYMNSSLESYVDNIKEASQLVSAPENHEVKNSESANSTRNSDVSATELGKSAAQKIIYKGIGYHMVNCGLILLKMLSEYVDISRSLPALSSEVVHRVVEFLKLFNTRACQLVLGAGAMQVSGLKSITSKHLALASQLTSFIYVIIPDIRHVLFLKIPDARKGLLLAEVDRVSQDYRIHRDEIHSKLVQIMRERLLVNLRKLPQIVETWNGPDDNDPQPSMFARAVTKEVSYLHRILSQILLDTDVHRIFRQVIEIFHSHLSEAFSNIEIRTPQCKNRLHRDVQHILDCIRKLPSDNSASVPNFGLLDEFLVKNFSRKEDHQ